MTGRMTALYRALHTISPALETDARAAYRAGGMAAVWALLSDRLPAGTIAGLRRVVQDANRRNQQAGRARQDVVIAVRRRR